MKTLLLTLALAGAAVLPAAHAQQTAAKGKYQLVFHISENNPQQWQLALNNAFAFQKNVGKDKADLEIVAIGPGLNMLKLESKVAAGVTAAIDRNIDVVACGETMQATKVSEADLIGGVRIARGGLIEIADRQRAGWVYIRP